MGRITETVKVLLIVNVIFYLGSLFVLNPDTAISIFALWFWEYPAFQFWQPLTHMFMHDLGSPMHIIFNMYALWAFGSAIENRLGRNRFIFFYFSAGLGAALIHSLVNYYNFQQGYQVFLDAGYTPEKLAQVLSEGTAPGTYWNDSRIPIEVSQKMFSAYNVPAVGASGAIYGVLVAFAMAFPNVALMLFFVPIPIKAKYFVPVLIIIDLFSGITGFSVFGQNIANWAHLGGALFGFVMMWYWKKNSFNQNRWN